MSIGIGADDLFVLVDAYKQSEVEVAARKKREARERRRAELTDTVSSSAEEESANPPTLRTRFCSMWNASAPIMSKNDVLKHRLAYAYDRAMKSIFNTSFTTAFAFLANLASPLMPTRSFGIWAAIVVIMNYIIDITWTPAGIIIYHKWFQCLPFCGCCFCCTWPVPCCPTNPSFLSRCNCCGKCLLSTFPFTKCSKLTDGGDDGPTAMSQAGCCSQPDDSCPGDIGPCPEEPFTWCAPSRAAQIASEMDELEAGIAGGDDGDEVKNPASRAARGILDAKNAGEADSEESDSEPRMGPVQLAFIKVYVPLILNPWVCTSTSPSDDDGAAPKKQEEEKAKLCPPKNLKIVSILCVIILGIYAGISTYFALQLSTPVDDERWFPKGHMLDTIFSYSREAYLESSATSRYVAVNLVFGVDSIDRNVNPSGKKFDSWNPSENRGTVVMDGSFSLATKKATDWILDTCTAVEAVACTANGCTGGTLVVSGATECVLRDLATWLNESVTKNGVGMDDQGNRWATSAEVTGVVGGGWVSGGLPLGDDKLADAMSLYYSKNRTAARAGLAGIKNNRIIYLNMRVTSTLEVFGVMNKNQGAHDAFDKFEESRNAEAAKVVGAPTFFHTTRTWNRLITQKAYVEGMYASLSICFPVTFGVLLFATRNIILAGFGILSIGCIVMCVLGWCQLVMGWYLGTAETIAAVMIVGLAVDYVVHLGHMFLESPLGRRSREERFIFSSVSMGVTVVGGAGTTFGAGVIMVREREGGGARDHVPPLVRSQKHYLSLTHFALPPPPHAHIMSCDSSHARLLSLKSSQC